MCQTLPKDHMIVDHGWSWFILVHLGSSWLIMVEMDLKDNHHRFQTDDVFSAGSQLVAFVFDHFIFCLGVKSCVGPLKVIPNSKKNIIGNFDMLAWLPWRKETYQSQSQQSSSWQTNRKSFYPSTMNSSCQKVNVEIESLPYPKKCLPHSHSNLEFHYMSFIGTSMNKKTRSLSKSACVLLR